MRINFVYLNVCCLILLSILMPGASESEAADLRLDRTIDLVVEDIASNPQYYPQNAELLDARSAGVDIELVFDEAMTPFVSQASTEAMLHRLSAICREYEGVRIAVQSGTRRKAVDSFLESPVYTETSERSRSESVRAIAGQSNFPYDGALKGIRIAISPGHGWYWWSENSVWNTQRGLVNGIIEDFNNARLADLHVVPALEHAGAMVFNCRERDFNTSEIIVDDGSPAPAYDDEGGWWDGAYVTGYGNGKYRVNNATSAAQAEKIAAWTPVFPTDGNYAVYVNYTAGTNRVTDARYTVVHAGGESSLLVDQSVNGSRWLFIGSYTFSQGSNGQGVYLSTLSGEANGQKVVIADAVKFGGGMGSILRNGQPSGKPRWQEAARYWVQFVGAPESAYNPTWADNSADVTARPLYANWQGVDAFVSLHSNAYNGNARGVGTWRYDGSNPSYPITAGSTELRDYIQEEVLKAIRAEWDSTWVNYGLHTANFGELRVLSTAPGALLELGFHDNPLDAAWLLKPYFRQTVARAITKALFKYFGVTAPLPPRQIQNISTSVVEPGRLRLSWQPQPESTWNGEGAPERYRIYVSSDGYGIDNGTIFTTSQYYDFHDLEYGRTYYFRVAGVNAGGESLISEPVAARISCTSKPALLIVNGFDRMDRSIQEENNTRDYLVRHARAVESAGDYYFVSASNEAFDSYDLASAEIAMIDWIGGEEAGTGGDTLFQALKPFRRQKLGDFMSQSGGALFISGSEIAWDAFVGANDAAYQSWVRNFLKADYVSDDAAEYGFVGTQNSIFAGLSGSFDNGTHGTYDVDWPDVIAPYDSSVLCATYGDTGKGLGVCNNTSSSKLVYLGIPFETLVGASLRSQIMARILQFIGSEQGNAGCVSADGDSDDSGDGDYVEDGDSSGDGDDFDGDSQPEDGDESSDGDSDYESSDSVHDSRYCILIGPKGGRLVANEGLEMFFPSGVLEDETEICVSLYDDADISPFVAIGGIWKFEPLELQFNLPVTVIMPFEQSRIEESSNNRLYWSMPGRENDFAGVVGAELNNGFATGLKDHLGIGFVGYRAEAENDGDENAADGDHAGGGDYSDGDYSGGDYSDGDDNAGNKDENGVGGGCNGAPGAAGFLTLFILGFAVMCRRMS